MRGWLLVPVVLLASVAVGEADSVPGILKRVQEDRGLGMPESTVFEQRKWTSDSARASLRAYIQARRALGRGETMAAYGLLTDAIGFDPDNAAAWRQLAFLRERERQYEQARQAWGKVLRIDPGDTDALYALGMASSRGDNVDRTARLLLSWELGDRHEQYDPMHPFRGVHVAATLAEAMDTLGEPRAAIALRDSARADIDALVQGAVGYPIDLGAWLKFVEVLHRDQACETAFDVISLLTPSSTVEDRQRVDLALLAIGLAVQFDDGQHVSALLHDLHRRGMLKMDRAGGVQADLGVSLDQAAMIFSRLGNAEGAAWLYQDVIEVDPDHVMARNNVGYYMLEQGHFDPAIERMLERAYREAPADSSVLDSYGWLQYMKGRFEDDEQGAGALDLLGEAHRRTGDRPSAEILDHLGDVYYRTDDLEAAVRAWSQALVILDNEQFRMDQISQLERLQQNLWGWWGQRIRNPSAVYDLRFGPLQDRLRAKLASAEAGEPPAVRRTFKEQAGD